MRAALQLAQSGYKTAVISKVRNPSWYVPKSVLEEHEADGRPLPPVVPPGPDNPLAMARATFVAEAEQTDDAAVAADYLALAIKIGDAAPHLRT